MTLAQKYDPFNPLHTTWLGALYCYVGQYEKAINTALESFEIQKDNIVGYYVLGATYLEMGRMDEAIESHRKLAELVPLWRWQLGLTYAVAGKYEEAENILDEYEKPDTIPSTAHGRIVLNAALGRIDEAFKWLNYESHHAWTAWIAVMPEGKNLLNDPRYQEFLNRLNLPD